jgi:hypothetical protein
MSATTQQAPWRWPLWLVAAAVMAALVALAVQARPLQSLRSLLARVDPTLCDLPELARMEAQLEQDRRAEMALRRELEDVQDDVLQHRALCRFPAPPAPVAPPPVIAATPPTPASPPATPQAPPAPPPQQQARADLPAERWRERDLGILEGCWQRQTNMQVFDRDSGAVRRVRRWQLCFDGNGSGTQELQWSDGTVCRGRLRARFAADGSLQFNDSGIPCSNGAFIYRQETACERRDDGTARCRARQPQLGTVDESIFRR